VDISYWEGTLGTLKTGIEKIYKQYEILYTNVIGISFSQPKYQFLYDKAS